MTIFWCTLTAIGEWLYGWQTLVAALIALLAALWTIKVMQDQMKVDAGRHNDALRRKQLAARARMPDALSEMSAYIRGCAEMLVGTVGALPEEPTPAIAALKEVIEFIDNSAAKRTFELVSWYQVVRARISREVPRPERVEFADQMYDLALLQGYANSLFEYARNEEDEVHAEKLSSLEMENALKNAFDLRHMVQNEELYVPVKAVIARRHGGDAGAKPKGR